MTLEKGEKVFDYCSIQVFYDCTLYGVDDRIALMVMTTMRERKKIEVGKRISVL